MKFQITLVKAFIMLVVAILTFCTDVAISQITEDGLVSYWSFNKDYIEGNTVIDLWGNNNANIVSAPQIVEGKFGEALNFNGSEDYVNCGDDVSLRIGRPLTVEFWFEAERDTLDDNIISYTDGTKTNYIVASYQSPDRLSFIRENAADTNFQLNSSTSIDKNWHHVAAVDDGKTFYLYLDGNLDNSQNFSFNAFTASGTLYIARSPEDWATNGFFKGTVDEVRIYNRALSENEVVQNMNAEGLGVISSNDKFPITWGKLKRITNYE